MTRIRPGESGHGGRTAGLRLRPVRIVDGVPQGGWTDEWEIICPACGDDINLDFVKVSPYLQRLRGPYATEAEGVAALRKHRGLPELSPATTPTPTTSGATVPTVPTETATPIRAANRPRTSSARERL